MVNNCANPKCLKPLHYLREGSIYIFDVSDTDAKGLTTPGHRLEHYWLCGDCSMSYLLERTPNKELRLMPKHSMRYARGPVAITEQAVIPERAIA